MPTSSSSTDRAPEPGRGKHLTLKPRGQKFPTAGLLALAFGLVLQLLMLRGAGVEHAPYTELKRWVERGEVTKVEVSPVAVRGERRVANEPAPRRFEVTRVDDPSLFHDLQAKGVEVTGATESSWGDKLFSLAITLGVPLLLFGFLFRGASAARGGMLGVEQSKAKVYMEEDVQVSFKDVAGVDEAKQELAEIVEFLQTPEKFQRLGGHIPKGVLLVGPPGTGKTLLARAIAGEAKVPFFSISGSEFVEMFVGVGAARVRDLFQRAAKAAPCIIFIDELDALGKARGLGPVAHEEREQTLNQLLVELDGFDPRVGVILIAATNRPEILDPALLRAGRFDRQVLVDRPDKAGRLAILQLHAKKVKLLPDAELETLASMTAGMAGADLANVINEAALLAVRRGREGVGKEELMEAVERVVAGLEKKSRVLKPEEKRRVAFHEVGHALVGMAFPGLGVLEKISIIPRGISALGYTLQVPTEDRFLLTRSELEHRISSLLGGRAAEELVFGEASTGAQDDLVKATAIARSMVTDYGMSESIGLLSLNDTPHPLLGAPVEPSPSCGPELSRQIDAEVQRILREQHDVALQVLRRREEVLHRAAAELLQRETLTGERLTRLAAETPERPVALLEHAGGQASAT